MPLRTAAGERARCVSTCAAAAAAARSAHQKYGGNVMCTPALGVIMGAALASDSLRARRDIRQRQGSDIAGQRWWGAPSDGVAKGPSRVDDDARVHVELLARERVAALRAIHGAACVLARRSGGGHESAHVARAVCALRVARRTRLGQPLHTHVVRHRRSRHGGRGGERHVDARVVHLAVVIHNLPSAALRAGQRVRRRAPVRPVCALRTEPLSVSPSGRSVRSVGNKSCDTAALS